MKYLVIDTLQDLKIVCEYYSKKPVIGLDTETTELEPTDGELRLVQMSDGKKTVILDVFHLLRNEELEKIPRNQRFEAFKDLKTLLTNPDVVKVIHNSKFEQKWLIHHCDISPTNVFDTFLASQVIDYNSENDPKKAHNLAAVTKRFLGIDLDKTEQRSDWSKWILSEEQLEYAALDVHHSPALYEMMYTALESDKLLDAAKIDFEVVPCIAETELYGLAVDRELYTKEIDTLKNLREEASITLQTELRPTTNINLVQPSFFDLPEVNHGDVLLTSSSQVLTALSKLGVPVFKSTDVEAIAKSERAGKPYAVGTGTKALSTLSDDYPIVRLLSDFRGVEKMCSAFGDNFLDHLELDEYGTERVHATFFIVGAPTGRMACRNPNLQQMPAGKVRVGDKEYSVGFRKAFNFPKGRVGVNADYSQIELRVVGEFSQEPIFIQAFRDEDDLHALTASMCFDVPYEECVEGGEHYKTHRTFAKRINFGIVYGIGPKGLAAQLQITPEEAWDIIQKHKQSHPMLWKYLDQQAYKAVKTLKARTASGRLQRFTEPSKGYDGQYDRGEVGAIGRNGKNMPIQGCLGGSSRILIPSQGYVKIQDARRTKQEVWDGKSYVNGNVATSGLKQQTVVSFNGGNNIECSPEHKFRVVRNGIGYWVEAKNLKKNAKILLTSNTPYFNLLSIDENYFRDLSSSEIGKLVACNFLFGKNGVWKIPESEYQLKKELNIILAKVGVVNVQTKEYKQTLVKDVFSFSDPQFYTKLDYLANSDGFSEECWTSKPFLEAFMQTFFNFATFKNEQIQVRVTQKLGKDLQQALYLFGVRSKLSKGLTKSFFTINKSDVYAFFDKVSILDPEKFVSIANKQKMSSYVEVMRYKPLTLTVADVTMSEKLVEMYDVVDSDSFQFMSNGLVTHNTSADILKRALKLLRDELKGMDAHVVNIVHDEITVECDENIAEEVRIKLQKAMVDAGEEYLTKVPVKVDAKIIENWGEK